MPTLVREPRDFLQYFRFLADHLGLRDWTIVVLDDPPDNPNAAATVSCVEGRKLAEISLSDRFVRDGEDEQRRVATHELLHCHHSHQGHLMNKWLNDEAYDAYVLAEENTIDGLADAIAPLMPMPSKVIGALGKAKPAKKRKMIKFSI